MHTDPLLTCILVGNKSDLFLERRQVPTEEGERRAQEEGLLFVEVSAKSGDNVEVAFEKSYVHTFDTHSMHNIRSFTAPRSLLPHAVTTRILWIYSSVTPLY